MRGVLVLAAVAFAANSASAQWAVIDAGNLRQSVTNHAVLTQQLSRLATQVSNQLRQIQQFDLELARMGDMGAVRNVVGFPEFRADLDVPTQIRAWADTLERIDGRGLFGDTRGGIYVEITAEFPDFDGNVIERDARPYVRAHDTIATVDEFKAVQSDVYVRREDLKRAIARTSEAMQAATTEAEQRKLEAVLNAQYSQLAAVDAEVALTAAEVQVKGAESAAMDEAKKAADAEVRRRLAQQEAEKLTAAFKPKYECLLQYVSERGLPER